MKHIHCLIILCDGLLAHNLVKLREFLIPAYPRAGKQFRMPLEYLKANGKY